MNMTVTPTLTARLDLSGNIPRKQNPFMGTGMRRPEAGSGAGHRQGILAV